MEVLGALSPSRAGDFMTCPLLYRFRTIDKLPEPPSPDAVRGTLVHKVLEDLFDLPAEERTPDRAQTMVQPAWEDLLALDPDLAVTFAEDGLDTGQWLASCRTVLERYFTLEDPRRLEPAEREVYVETLLGVAPAAARVHRPGRRRPRRRRPGRRLQDRTVAPGEMFEAKALFQMKFYALVLWRTRGVVPAVLQLIYLGNGEMLRYCPDEADLLAMERKVQAVWEAISRAEETGDWRPRRGRCAAGARTRRCARSSAAPRRRCPRGPCRWSIAPA